MCLCCHSAYTFKYIALQRIIDNSFIKRQKKRKKLTMWTLENQKCKQQIQVVLYSFTSTDMILPNTANILQTHCTHVSKHINGFLALVPFQFCYCTQMQNQWSNYMSSMYSTQLTIALGCVGSLTRLDIKSSVYLLLQLSGHNYQVDYAICFHNPLSFDRKWHRVIHYNL